MAAAALGKKRMAEDDGEDALAADGMDEASPAAKKTCVLEVSSSCSTFPSHLSFALISLFWWDRWEVLLHASSY